MTPDVQLLREALAGEMRSLGALVERHFGLVYTVALARLRDPEIAEDLAQEVMLRACLHLERLGPQGNFPAWVARIARNLATDWQRRGQRASRLLPMVPLEQMKVPEVPDRQAKGARETMASDQESQALREALFELPEEERELVMLHYTEGLSQSEIAERLGTTQPTVSRQLKRALARLRGRLEPLLREVGPSLRAPRGAVARSVAFVAAASALSATAKASLLAAAPASEIASATEAAQAGVSGAVGVVGFLKSLSALIAGGAQLMATGKGIVVTAVAVAAIAGGTYHFTHTSDRAGTATPSAAAPSVTAPTGDIASAYPYTFTQTQRAADGTTIGSSQLMFLAPGRVRDIRANATLIWDGVNHPDRFLLIDDNRRLAAETVMENLAQPSDPLQQLTDLMRSPHTELGQREIDGHRANGFTDGRWTLWLDADTGLPVRLEVVIDRGNDDPRDDGLMVLSGFQYGLNLDPSLFEMTPPPGYTLVARDAGPRVPTEERLIEGLRAATVLTGGDFPPDFSMEWLVSWAQALQARIPSLSEAELARIRAAEDPVRQGIRFAEYIKMQRGEWSYTGAGVRFGDASRAICTWRLPDDRVEHVVMGDLTTREVASEETAALASPEPPILRSLFDALMAGDWTQAAPLFFDGRTMAAFAQRIGQPMMPPDQLSEMLAEQRRLFDETSAALRAAGSVEYIGVRAFNRDSNAVLPGVEDAMSDVSIRIRVNGREREIFFNVMIKFDGRWLIVDGPTLR
jgi:RNA polymerase sigma factor (sigma-70 family)